MAPAFERVPESLEVVYLTVEDAHHRPILVRDRLVTSMQINDGEPPHAKSDTPLGIEEEPFVVGTSVNEGIGHGVDVLGANFYILAQAELSGDAAHGQGAPGDADSAVRWRTTRAGLPATMHQSGTSETTTLPAPTIQWAPTFAITTAAFPIQLSVPMRILSRRWG
jgi:hypothetical protein